jgi:transposase
MGGPVSETSLELAHRSTPEPTLEQLSAEIRQGHAAVQSAVAETLTHALSVGDALLRAKARIERGRFVPWIEEECGLVYNTANGYMRLARYRDALPLGLPKHEALEYIRGLPSTDGRKLVASHPEAVKQEARRRRREGQRYRDIASALGVSDATIFRWCKEKEYKKGAIDRARQRRAFEELGRQEAKRKDVARRAKERGGSVAKAYSLVRQLAQELDRAISTEEDLEVKTWLKASLRETYAAERYVGRSLGVEYGAAGRPRRPR